MMIGADVRHADDSAVPSELIQLRSGPGVETPGYCHLSLRDKAGRITDLYVFSEADTY